MHNILFPGQSGHQHNQGRFRQVEIGDQAIDHLEFVAWIDENLGPATSRLQDSILSCGRFQCTAAGSSNCDHAAAVFLGVVDQLRLVSSTM